jgi:nitrogen fixation protein NifX
MTQVGHVKIALTTNNLMEVDADFLSAKQFVFYDVGYDSAEFVDCVQFGMGGGGGVKKGPGGGQGCSLGSEIEDKGTTDLIGDMVDALKGCSILFTRGLSDPQAMRVKGADVFPVKMEKTREIPDVIDVLQGMMNNNPPLWLRRALRDNADRALQVE